MVQQKFFCVRTQPWNSSPPVALVSNCTYLDWPLPLCAYLLCGWLHGGSVFNCKYSVFHIYLTFTFFSEFLCNFFPRQSQIKSIRTWQKFQPLSPGSQCWNQANFGKKSFSKPILSSGVGEEICAIFVAFILSGILGSKNFLRLFLSIFLMIPTFS